MDLKKNDKKTPYLTPKGKAVALITLISGGLSYLIMSLRILGKYSNEIKLFLEINLWIFGIIFFLYFSYILGSILSDCTEDLINKK